MNAKGWVHRDVKPDNMLVNSAGELKLIDFAIAERIPTGFAKWFRVKNKPQGTRSYMSPEQIRGQVLDGRADVYSFAATRLRAGGGPAAVPRVEQPGAAQQAHQRKAGFARRSTTRT